MTASDSPPGTASDPTIDEPLPADLASTLQAAFGLAEPPETLGDWLADASALLDDSPLSVGVDDLCATDDSRHAARVDGERRYFHCVLDALLLPFLAPDSAPIAVRSKSPVSGVVVELTVSRDDVSAAPPDAVMSFGLAADTAVPDPGGVDAALAYSRICPYINAFASRAEYDRWAENTPDAATTAFSFDTGLALARTLADRPPYEAD